MANTTCIILLGDNVEILKDRLKKIEIIKKNDYVHNVDKKDFLTNNHNFSICNIDCTHTIHLAIINVTCYKVDDINLSLKLCKILNIKQIIIGIDYVTVFDINEFRNIKSNIYKLIQNYYEIIDIVIIPYSLDNGNNINYCNYELNDYNGWVTRISKTTFIHDYTLYDALDRYTNPPFYDKYYKYFTAVVQNIEKNLNVIILDCIVVNGKLNNHISIDVINKAKNIKILNYKKIDFNRYRLIIDNNDINEINVNDIIITSNIFSKNIHYITIQCLMCFDTSLYINDKYSFKYILGRFYGKIINKQYLKSEFKHGEFVKLHIELESNVYMDMNDMNYKKCCMYDYNNLIAICNVLTIDFTNDH